MSEALPIGLMSDHFGENPRAEMGTEPAMTTLKSRTSPGGNDVECVQSAANTGISKGLVNGIFS